MSGKNGCTCDYSYTCPQCQARIDAMNQAEYLDEVKAWTAESLKLIAAKLGIELPEEPKKRSY